MKFELDEKQVAAAESWMKSQVEKNPESGCGGGRFQYRFTPNHVEDSCSIYDAVTKEELDLTWA